MSKLQYNSYPGFGQELAACHRYSQAVRVPPGETVTISGQGGWNRTTGEIPSDLSEEINQAFDNVHHALVSAGGPGMPSVYKLVVYLAPISAEALKLSGEARKKWFPDHHPILTGLGVADLALPGMRIEIEAWAHLG